eukprot:7787634-Pyramimonas_sp.AAC.1
MLPGGPSSESLASIICVAAASSTRSALSFLKTAGEPQRFKTSVGPQLELQRNLNGISALIFLKT